MGDSTITGPAALAIYVEDIGSSIKMPAFKIHTGALGTDGGPVTATNALRIQGATLTAARATTLATAGILIKTGSGVVYAMGVINTTGGAIFGQLFDATVTQSNSTAPYQSSASTATNNQTVTTLGSSFYGLPFATGLWLQMSSTIHVMTSIASTSVAYYVLYS